MWTLADKWVWSEKITISQGRRFFGINGATESGRGYSIGMSCWVDAKLLDWIQKRITP